jgi:hypothetical protein
MPDLAHRRTDARVRVLEASGAPLAGVQVTVEQARHAFGFGNIGSDLIECIAGPPPSDIAGTEQVFGGGGRGQWWMPPARATTDEHGIVAVTGFAGTYRVSTDAASADAVLTAEARS